MTIKDVSIEFLNAGLRCISKAEKRISQTRDPAQGRGCTMSSTPTKDHLKT